MAFWLGDGIIVDPAAYTGLDVDPSVAPPLTAEEL